MNTQNIVPPSYYLPGKTANIVESQIKQCKNPSLILDKYVPGEVIDDTKTRGSWLRKFGSEYAPDSELVKSAYKRWESMLKACNATRFNATLEWRMVVGLGGKGVLEIDMTLHHLYGIPYIPGSALKGLTRAFASGKQEYYVSPDEPEAEPKPSLKEETDHHDILRIFGTQKAAGTVIFFDAMPVDGQCSFVVDIMNPHYPNYYNSLQNKTIQAPTNDQSPKLITFLTIQNATFTFALAARDPKYLEDVNTAQGLLQEALEKYGIGGKTSAGYGYFQKAITTTESSQSPGAPEQATQRQTPSKQTERIRPKVPPFREGQQIAGVVIAPTDDIRRMAPPDTKAFLTYQSYSTNDVLVVVIAEGVLNWVPGNMRNCILLREEMHDGCIVLICKPKPKK